ncbi:IS3 family transposase, partial [Caballeronia sp. LZ002]|uniref:IS3 family transposase n=1 Tax=Caballeronia sp. LZ002 TaxID=3038558 RepID=UPI0038D35E09
KDYCAGHHGLKVVARRHGINVESLRRWAALYRVHGAEGVQEKRRATYSLEFKLSVLQRMRDDELSYRQVAALFDIRNFNIIGNWEHAYDEGGMAGLSPYASVRRPRMKKPSTKKPQPKSYDGSSPSRKELLAELDHLRMENAYLKKRRLSSSEEARSAAVKARIVLELRQQYPLAGLLKVAGLARSTFYYQKKALGIADKYASLKVRIRSIFDEHKGRYGYRRITAVIRQEGTKINHKTIQRLMGELRLKSYVRLKKYRAFRGEVGLAAPNILERRFDAKRPNDKWVTDVTEFNVGGEKLYLSPVLDLYNAEVIAFEIARRPLFDMVGTMLKRAFARLGPNDRPILHSDQGWQYRMPVYRKALDKHSVKQSMSRRGNCLDNAAMESFFGTLKSEFFHLNKFRDVDELHAGLKNYIHYYNHKRIKMKLGGVSPVAYRSLLATA